MSHVIINTPGHCLDVRDVITVTVVTFSLQHRPWKHHLKLLVSMSVIRHPLFCTYVSNKIQRHVRECES